MSPPGRLMSPLPTHRLAQLSDLHLTTHNEPFAGQIDTDAQLRLALQRLAHAGQRLDAVVLSGDLTDAGSPAAYQRLRALIDEQARLLGCPILVGAGNHDSKQAFNASLGPADNVTEVRGLRIIQLDSSVPGTDQGELSASQLDWLAQVLATPAEHGTVLVVHHPPAPSASVVMSVATLRNIADLAGVVAGADVRIILSGHWHTPASSTFAGIPVAVAGGVSYVADPLFQARGYRALVGGQSFNLVEFYPGQVVTLVVPVTAATLHQIDL